MIGYRDMTFCNAECLNMKCDRNKQHIPEDTHGLPVAYANFLEGCKKYEPSDERKSKGVE